MQKIKNPVLYGGRTNLAIEKEKLTIGALSLRLAKCREEQFRLETGGEKASEVREYFKSEMKKLFGCGSGHYVTVLPLGQEPDRKKGMGYDLISPSACHFYLKKENYDEAVALLTEEVKKAYACIGFQIWIDPKSHIEYWETKK